MLVHLLIDDEHGVAESRALPQLSVSVYRNRYLDGAFHFPRHRRHCRLSCPYVFRIVHEWRGTGFPRRVGLPPMTIAHLESYAPLPRAGARINGVQL